MHNQHVQNVLENTGNKFQYLYLNLGILTPRVKLILQAARKLCFVFFGGFFYNKKYFFIPDLFKKQNKQVLFNNVL